MPWAIPVLVVRYLPERRGRVDRRITGDVGGRVDDVRQRTVDLTAGVVEALESGSAHHRYNHPASEPALRYELVDTIEFGEPLPTWSKPRHTRPMTDYTAIMDRIEVAEWVLGRGVKEVWLWGYHGGVVDLWESNMAGPHGDISNSDRDPTDLPVLDRTYTVYHYNYGRGVSEAVEDHMHQIEAVLRHVDRAVFWDNFVARCGWAHYPPNGTRDYDWANRTPVWTDIEDWRPEGGRQIEIDCRRWGCNSLGWFLYWMQSLPVSWWHFIGDFDDAVTSGRTLV